MTINRDLADLVPTLKESGGKIGIGATSVTNELTFGATTSVISPDTSDAADSKRIRLCGGGEATVSRGAYVTVYGNEYSGTEGELTLVAGNATAGNILFYTGNAVERMRIGTNGTITTSSTISVGGATPSTSGAGITFPATQSASTNANTLDDYEEGTFTPTMFGSSTAGTTTYTHQEGFYAKVGRIVFIQVDVRWTNATGTGFLHIGGFPFTARDINANLNIGTNNITLSANNISTWLQMYVNDTKAQTYSMPTGGGGFNDVAIDTAGGMWINGFYYTNT